MRAAGVAYVTKRVLQERYPARFMSANISDVDLPEEAVLGGVVSTHYSSVELDPLGIAGRVREPKRHGPYEVVVASLAQLYKGTDVLIEAVARCARVGFDLTAVIVGDGKYRPQLMAQAERRDRKGVHRWSSGGPAEESSVLPSCQLRCEAQPTMPEFTSA